MKRKEKKEMMDYRVIHSRFDCPPEVAGSFKAASHDEAKCILKEKYATMESLSWDDLRLIHVVQSEIIENVDFMKRQN